MAKTKTSSTVKNRYNAKAYDQLPIRVPKGRKADIQDYATAVGQSLNGYVVQAIDERIERETPNMAEGNT
jgi:predicted HicB family RNase H-like nuclease